MDNKHKIVFLFSGQGSQYRGMGQKLFEENTIFRNSIEQSDLLVQKHLHRSLIDELYKVKQLKLDNLLITHPAIVAVEIAVLQVMEHAGIKADYVAGNSLGEFAAAVANGIWSAEMAIEAAIEQAKSIVRSNEPGGMLAVIYQKRENIQHLYAKHNLFLASDNFNEHFTLSGTVQNLDAFQSELHHLGINFLRLPVTFPFHSPLIQSGYNGFKYYMASATPLSNPKQGFISGIDCIELNILPQDYFWNVVSTYTNFPQTIKYIENRGPNLYIDLGPSGTSSTFVKYNLNPGSLSKTFQIMTPFKREVEQLKALQQLLPEYHF